MAGAHTKAARGGNPAGDGQNPAGRCSRGFALAFSDICGVSAGAWAAYGMAAASCGLVTYPVSLGIAAAFLMRMLWGLTTRWELLIGAVPVLLSPHVLRQRNGAFPLIATSLALLPGAIIGVWQGSAATLLFGIGHHSAGNALRAGSCAARLRASAAEEVSRRLKADCRLGICC